MFETLMPVILAMIRHGLTTAGGGLVAKGILDAPGLETLIGALMTLVGASLSLWKARKEVAAKLAAPAAGT